MTTTMSRWIYWALVFFLWPAGMFLAAYLPTLWWSKAWPGDPSQRIVPALFVLLAMAAAAYQTGYKGMARDGGKLYFYLAFVVPVSIAIAGFLYGVFRIYVK